MHRAEDMVDEAVTSLVGDCVTPADARFACRLFEEHYNAVDPDEYGSVDACAFGWELANRIAGMVEDDPDFDWLNAYFVGTNVVEVLDESEGAALPDEDWDGHPDWIDIEAQGVGADIKQALNEMRDTASLHIDLDEDLDDYPRTRAAVIATTFRFIGKRYAADIPDDMMESFNIAEILRWVLDVTEDGLPEDEALRGARLVEDWLRHRCRKQHEALAVGT